MVHVEIGVADAQGECIESCLQRAIELVASHVHRLRVPQPSSSGHEQFNHCSRVLVFGRESDHRAQFIAERNYFSRTVGAPAFDQPSAPGVFWVVDVAELEDLDDESFDAVMLFNVSSSGRFRSVFDHISRIIRPGGVIAGTGVFKSLSASGSSDLRTILAVDQSLRDFRDHVEQNGYFMNIGLDLSMEGFVSLCIEQDGKRSEIPSNCLFRENITCALFLASKIEDASRQFHTPMSVSQQPISVPTALPAFQADPVVVTGVALGLPNELRPDCNVFDPENFSRIFSGENCISQLTLAQKQKILDQNIVQVLKVDGQRVKRKLQKPSEVISLASRLGRFDLGKEYGVPAHVVETLDVTYQLAIAAGLEALCNAGIPVLQRSADKSIPTVSPLPESMQAETGVIFASSFPCTESVVQEVTLSAAHHTRQLLAECKALYDEAERNGSSKSQVSPYEFDRKLLFKLLVMANAQLAELVHAKGPNTHVNSACASTTQAIAIAHDWIRLGRCKRVVVISADNATSDNLLPYLGTGFLALTAASIAPTVETGALPFDKRRNGMILGMGAVGMVLESSRCALQREVRPLTELVGSHFLNSAFHGSLLCREHISQELKVFIDRMEAELHIPRETIANELLYYSHETCTSAQGGCAKAEMDALELAFGSQAKPKILVANTKGFTGHPMGVGLEDVVAVASLDQGLVPPLANFKEVDPCLGPVLLSQGGSHNRKFALRFAAGFGSQFVFLLFRKWGPECLPNSSPRLSPAIVAPTFTTNSEEPEIREEICCADDPYSVSISSHHDTDSNCDVDLIKERMCSTTSDAYSRMQAQSEAIQRYLLHMQQEAIVNEIAEPPHGDDRDYDFDPDQQKQLLQMLGYTSESGRTHQANISSSNMFAASASDSASSAAFQSAPFVPAESHRISSRRLPHADVQDSCSLM